MIPLKDENPTRTVPFVTLGLIAGNVFIYSYMLLLGPDEVAAVVRRYAVVPSELFVRDAGAAALAFPTLASSMFLHGSLLHVAGNMWFLWIFGDNVEDTLGHFRFLLFYLACGVTASLSYAMVSPGSGIPMIGASGAVSAVLGAYIVLFPGARIWTFFFFIFFWKVARVPAVFIIGLWIILQLVSGLASYGEESAGIAWFAHIGGFLAGAVLILLLRNKKSGRYAR